MGEEVLRILNTISHDTEVLVKTDTFGKEELLVAMANHLQSLVCFVEGRPSEKVIRAKKLP